MRKRRNSHSPSRGTFVEHQKIPSGADHQNDGALHTSTTKVAMTTTTTRAFHSGRRKSLEEDRSSRSRGESSRMPIIVVERSISVREKESSKPRLELSKIKNLVKFRDLTLGEKVARGSYG